MGHSEQKANPLSCPLSSGELSAPRACTFIYPTDSEQKVGDEETLTVSWQGLKTTLYLPWRSGDPGSVTIDYRLRSDPQREVLDPLFEIDRVFSGGAFEHPDISQYLLETRRATLKGTDLEMMTKAVVVAYLPEGTSWVAVYTYHQGFGDAPLATSQTAEATLRHVQEENAGRLKEGLPPRGLVIVLPPQPGTEAAEIWYDPVTNVVGRPLYAPQKGDPKKGEYPDFTEALRTSGQETQSAIRNTLIPWLQEQLPEGAKIRAFVGGSSIGVQAVDGSLKNELNQPEGKDAITGVVLFAPFTRLPRLPRALINTLRFFRGSGPDYIWPLADSGEDRLPFSSNTVLRQAALLMRATGGMVDRESFLGNRSSTTLSQQDVNDPPQTLLVLGGRDLLVHLDPISSLHSVNHSGNTIQPGQTAVICLPGVPHTEVPGAITSEQLWSFVTEGKIPDVDGAILGSCKQPE